MQRKSKRPAPDPRMQALLTDLKDTKTDLAQAYNCFNYVREPELVEACVYEISALQSRCNYLLRVIKEQNATAAMEKTGGEATWV